MFPEAIEQTFSSMRVILAKMTQKGELKHIAGAFTTNSKEWCIQTKEEHEIGSYLVYIKMDELSEKDKFSVMIATFQIESIQEVDHQEYPDFIEKWIKDYALSHKHLYKSNARTRL